MTKFHIFVPGFFVFMSLLAMCYVGFHVGGKAARSSTISEVAVGMANADIYDYKRPKYYITGETWDFRPATASEFKRLYGVDLIPAHVSPRNSMFYQEYTDNYNSAVDSWFSEINGISVHLALRKQISPGK